MQLTERSARVSVPSSEVIGMSETEYGASWPPASSDDTEEDAEPAADPEPDETPGRYTGLSRGVHRLNDSSRKHLAEPV